MGVKIKGLDKLSRKLERLPEQIKSEVEQELRRAAEQVCERAREVAGDPLAKIDYRIYRTDDSVCAEITASQNLRKALEQAFEELKPSFPDHISEALKRAIKA